MSICKLVHYQGTVQGVGFRITTKRIADGFAVAGYVRNLPDGRVEVMVVGEAKEVETFLTTVADRMASYIQHHETADAEARSFSSFEIWT